MNNLSADSLIFNAHDLILVMAAAQYLLFAVLLEGTRRRSDISSHLLALILLLNTFKALDTLLLWSEFLRTLVLDWNPNLLFIGSLAYWLEGPLLYLYVSAVLYRDFRFKPVQLLHLIPACLAVIFLLWHYYFLPGPEQIEQMAELHFMWSTPMEILITLRNLSIVVYGGWCLWELRRYRKLLQENYANIEDRERRWLNWFIGGFVVLAGWALVVHTIGEKLGDDIANVLGICTNYFTFLFVNSLVFLSIRYTHLFDGIDKDQTNPPDHNAGAFKPEQIDRVINYVSREKPFLDPNINMEALAKRLSLPERTFSRILNQHFGKNFFEFINEHRVDEAKRLLADPNKKDMNMLDILADAGFSSKSTFNAIFKQYTGQTPSQYRRSASL